MIYFNANGRSAECSSDEPITTGSVGIPVEFTFSSEWDGLAKTAVFQTDSTVIDVYIPDNACVVPPEAIAREGRKLVIGVYGANGIDVVIPTVYARAGFIMKGAEPSGIEPTPHTQSLVDQILAAAQDAQDAAEDAQETAQSVRDDADSGVFAEQAADMVLAVSDDEPTDEPLPKIWIDSDDSGIVQVPTMEDIGDLDDLVTTAKDNLVSAINEAAQSGGGGGTSDYSALTNKPQINSVTLSGNKTAADLDLEPEAMVVTVTDTGGAALHADKNAQQIYDAFAAGMRVVAYFEGVAYTLVITDERGIQAVFSAVLQGRIYYLSVDQSGNAMPTSWQPGSYSKPSGGIPASDLASAVQTSLGKADTALQSAPVTSVNGQTGAVVLSAPDVGAGTYSKPSGGIPKTDLASAVQTSLGKADTALQSYTETDPTVPSWAKQSSKPTYTASEVGAIAAPSSPATGAFLVWNGTAWTAQTLATWQASSY